MEAMNGAIETSTLALKLQIPRAVAANMAGNTSVVEFVNVHRAPDNPNLVITINTGISLPFIGNISIKIAPVAVSAKRIENNALIFRRLYKKPQTGIATSSELKSNMKL